MFKSIGKIPIKCSPSPGYIVPRIQTLAMNEAARIYQEKIASSEDIDKSVIYGFGLRFAVLGLLEFIDWGGVDTLDTTQTASMTPETGPALVAGQVESNALAKEGATPSITDASSSTVVNNSNQSMMMPLPDPNPHNMDFRVEERLFPT